MFYNRRSSWRKNTHDRQWLTPERRCWTLLHFIPYILSLSFSLLLFIPSLSFLSDFIRPPSTPTPPSHLLRFLLPNNTQFRRDIYRMNTRSLALSSRNAPHRGWFRLHSSLRFVPSAKVVSCDRERVYIVRKMGSALIRKLYEYCIPCYGSFSRGLSYRRRTLWCCFNALVNCNKRFFKKSSNINYTFRRT